MLDLSILNPEQRKAVTADLGPVVVLAGPGSGKTAVLVRRIIYMIETLHVPPFKILATTFTKKAAEEMKKRLTDMVGERGSKVQIMTLHAFCSNVVTSEAKTLGVSGFKVADEKTADKMLEQALADLNCDPREYPLPRVKMVIADFKNNLMTAVDVEAKTKEDDSDVDLVISHVYNRYQQILRDQKSLDFDDLLVLTFRLFDENLEVLRKYQVYHPHLLVDEFQDICRSQYAILHKLAWVTKSFFVVGDPDQAIYAWRGAKPKYMKDVIERYKASVIILGRNYRSRQNILDAAMSVIEKQPDRIPKQLVAAKGAGGNVVVRSFEDEYLEAEYITQVVKDGVRRGQKCSDYAVLCRVNSLTRAIEEDLAFNGVPARVIGGTSFYERREIRDLIAYLKWILDPDDTDSFMRILNVPLREIGPKTKAKLEERAALYGTTVGHLVTDPHFNNPRSGSLRMGRVQFESLQDLRRLHKKWRKKTAKPFELLKAVIDDIEYFDFLEDGTIHGEACIENVDEFLGMAKTFEGKNLDDFLKHIGDITNRIASVSTGDAVTIMTLHAAKGLEFPVCFIPGLDEGTLPHRRSIDSSERLEEERRLLFVGLTRAEDQVYLLWPESRRSAMNPDDQKRERSRFLYDIPVGLAAACTS